MPKHLLVDGFNVIRRDDQLSGVESKNFYGAQDQLVARLGDYRRGTHHRVTVVFDGREGPNTFRSRGRKGEVEIIYSAHGETADDVIVDLVEKAADRGGIMVVTADRGLANACKVYGALVVPPEELLARSRPRALPTPGYDGWQGKREEQGWSGTTRKKGNAKKLPKAKRKPSRLW
jgi:predicted RNA-binding protein with PIN domain